MKAILEYNLPEDQEDFQLAANAAKWHSVCWDMDQYLRSNTKYAPDSMSEEMYIAYQECMDKLHLLMNEQGLSLDL